MNNLLEQTFAQVNMGILVINKESTIVLCNHFMSDHIQKSTDQVIGTNIFDTFPELPENWLTQRFNNIFLLKNSSFISWEQRSFLFDIPNSRPVTGSNEKMIQNCSLLPIMDQEHNVTHICITVNDATAIAMNQIQLKKTSIKLTKEKKAQQILIEKLEETKNQLLQSEKMASIGQLAAGVAHEINNPVGFIKSNFSSLKHYANELNQTMDKYFELIKNINDDELLKAVNHINEEHDIDFVIEDITHLLNESFDGINRIEDIVKSLKHFSRADNNQWEEADINSGIESTLKVVTHELKYIADIDKDYGELPLVQCLPMQINQVLMNLLVNAGQAIEKESNVGRISIRTSHQNNDVRIVIKDNGEGIKEENLVKIFDPFFTTKPVGEGTGLGLSLSYSIIKEHKGDISAESTIGKGTTFTITLPIKQIEKSNNSAA